MSNIVSKKFDDKNFMASDSGWAPFLSLQFMAQTGALCEQPAERFDRQLVKLAYHSCDSLVQLSAFSKLLFIRKAHRLSSWRALFLVISGPY